MPDDLTNPCCKCTTPQYSIHLNTQGPPGKQGEQGFPGVSPVVTVAVQTDTTYKLNITDANGTITTPNLQGRGVPRGGEIGDILVKTGSADFDATWQDAYLNMPLATATTPGIVQPDNVTTTVSGGVLSAHLAVNFQEPLSMKYKYYGLPEYLNTYNGLIAGNNLATTNFVPYAINNESSTGANAIFFPSNWVTEDGTGWQLPVDSGRSYMVVRNFNSGDTIHTPLTYADLSQLYGACIVWGNYNSNTGVFIPKLCYVPIYTYSNKIGTTTDNAVLTNTRTHYFATIGSNLNNLKLTTLFTDSTTSAATYALNNIQLTEVDNSVTVRAFNDGQTIVKTGELDNSFQSYNINAVLLNIPKTLSIDPGSPITTLTGAIEADDLYITNAIGEKVWEVDYSTANTEVALDIGNGLTLDDEGKLIANIDNSTITFNEQGQMVAQGGGGSGTSNYTQLTNKPQINSVELSGNKTSTELGLAGASEVEELGTELNQLAGDVTSLTTTVGQKVNYTDLTNYYTKKEADAAFATLDDLNTKIDTAELDTYIQAGTNISISKSDNILTISATGGGGEGGTTDYTQLTNKPQINNVELSGNKTLDDLGIQAKGDYALSSDIPEDITTQGNTFNGANQLVQLDASGKLPALDGSQLTNLPSGGGTGDVTAAGDNTFTGVNTFSNTLIASKGIYTGTNRRILGYTRINDKNSLVLGDINDLSPGSQVYVVRTEKIYKIVDSGSLSSYFTAGDGIGISNEGNNITISTSGPKLWTGTQTEYDGIASKDNNTLYFITGT